MVTPVKSVIVTSGAFGSGTLVLTFTGVTSTPFTDIETALGNDAGGTFTTALPVTFWSVAVPSINGLVEVLDPYSS